MDQRARSAPNQKTPIHLDSELVELLWQNGGVVAQAQAQAQAHQRSFGRGQSGVKPGTSGVTGEETAVLFPDGDALDSDLYSQLWHSIANVDRHGGRDTGEFERPPARSGAGSSRTGEVGSSFCGSNMVTGPALRVDDDIDDAALPPREEEPGERAGASSSGGSGSNALFKRGRDELDSRSEDADCEAVDETRPSRRPAAKRRTRAAEVHNLSERRRRDRINEKMRALQELVPHCNKTDRASILDEAIEYLKSLQLQVQIMWMTSGMAPMMFPGAHQLMSPMAMGLNSACMPAAQGLSQLQGVPPYMNNPLPNQMTQVPSPAINAPNVANQMQNNGICEPRNPFLHPNDTVTAAPQTPGLFSYGSQMAQRNEIQELLARTAIPASGAKPPSSSDGTGT